MPSHRVLISTFLLASAVLANDHAASGGVVITSPVKGTFESIAATFQVPYLFGKPEDAVAAFISLDDEECLTFVQLGINFRPWATPNFFEFWLATPGNKYILPPQYSKVHTGDVIKFTITAPSERSPTGSFSLVNTNNGLNQTLPLDLNGKPCGRKVKWFMSNVPYTGNSTSYHDICNFGMLNFTGAVAHGPTGQIYAPQDKEAQTTNVSFYNGTSMLRHNGTHVPSHSGTRVSSHNGTTASHHNATTMSPPNATTLATVEPGQNSVTFKYLWHNL